jgi:flavin reductase
MSVDNASFRRAAGQFASGIVVVTTRGGHAMTVSAFTSVSLDPPLVLFCAEKIARFHDAVLAEGSWAVSILAEDDEKTARWLAIRGRPMDGQLDGVAHHPGPATGAPLLDDALAVLECRTTAVHDAGDHTIVVGEVQAVTAPPETPQTPEAPQAPSRGPLLHYSGAYRRLSTPQDLGSPPESAPPNGVVAATTSSGTRQLLTRRGSRDGVHHGTRADVPRG